MSTGAERPASMPFQDSQYNWTDDLPVCKQSGMFCFIILKILTQVFSNWYFQYKANFWGKNIVLFLYSINYNIF